MENNFHVIISGSEPNGIQVHKEIKRHIGKVEMCIQGDEVILDVEGEKITFPTHYHTQLYINVNMPLPSAESMIAERRSSN